MTNLGSSKVPARPLIPRVSGVYSESSDFQLQSLVPSSIGHDHIVCISLMDRLP